MTTPKPPAGRNGLTLRDDMAATLQARMSWPAADACADDLMGRFGRMMRDCPLTCVYCKSAPATHLLVADLKSRRATDLVCEPCGGRGVGDAVWVAAAESSIWLFALIPAGKADR
jgi:hypothetical protein